MQSLLILGRQPELGLAELESLYGSKKLTLIAKNAVVVDIDPCYLAFKRLGGSIKFAKLLTILPTNKWSDIENFLVSTSPQHVLAMPPGKMTLGLSAYGFSINPKDIMQSALKIKRSIQANGRSVRLVPNKTTELNTAQVIHNKLTADRSWELLLIKSEAQTYIAQTVMVQDIAGYSNRDQNRPFRDSKVGMLPPKLAQIIINLASGQLNLTEMKAICDTPKEDQRIQLNQTVLDPFCGSGVILQEAYLMGYDILGSDIDERMVQYSRNNLKWLADKYNDHINPKTVQVGDATNIDWPTFDFVATETSLGKPLTKIPKQNEIEQQISRQNTLIKNFLLNLARQLKPGDRVCIAIASWQIDENEFIHLPLIDQITDLGYNFIDFKHYSTRQLIYYRPGQIVARQLLVLVRK
ncbi:MAG: TRM11 family SAM-dependent methyltransferase [Candidatus Saccharimonadales bacterium]